MPCSVKESASLFEVMLPSSPTRLSPVSVGISAALFGESAFLRYLRRPRGPGDVEHLRPARQLGALAAGRLAELTLVGVDREPGVAVDDVHAAVGEQVTHG